MCLTDTSFAAVAVELRITRRSQRWGLFPQNSMLSSTQDSMHSLSTHPDWVVDGDAGEVEEEDNNVSPLLGQPEPERALPAEADPQLGFQNGQCAELHHASDKSKALLLVMSCGLASLQGPERCLGDVEVEPHKSFKPRNKIACSNKEMALQVTRRAEQRIRASHLSPRIGLPRS